MRGLWASTEHVEHLKTFVFAIFFDCCSQNDFVAGFMFFGVEEKASAQLRLLESPAGKYPRNFGHIVLRITAIDAQGMQLHQLTGVVFIQSFLLLRFNTGLWRFATVSG